MNKLIWFIFFMFLGDLQQCLAIYDFSQLSIAEFDRKWSPPKLMMYGCEELMEGSKLQLEVVIPALYVTVQIKWFKNGVELDGSHKRIFVIENITLSDAANYSSQVTILIGGVQKTSCDLIVRKKTRLIHELVDTSVRYGEDVAFNCSSITDPSFEVKVWWMKDGCILTNYSKFNVAIDKNNSLIIKSATELDAGMYTCIIGTNRDYVVASATLDIKGVNKNNFLYADFLYADCNWFVADIKWFLTDNNHSPLESYIIRCIPRFRGNITYDFTGLVLAPWLNDTFQVIGENVARSITYSHSRICSLPFFNSDIAKKDDAYIIMTSTYNPKKIEVIVFDKPKIERKLIVSNFGPILNENLTVLKDARDKCNTYLYGLIGLLTVYIISGSVYLIARLVKHCQRNRNHNSQ